MTFDRDAILARTDLAQLADELLGGHKGSGTSARWPSPVPGHPQTGKTPPMTIFRARNGIERWTCWATGASGTAIDLLVTVDGVTVREALARLGARAGVREGEGVERIACRSPSPAATPMPSASALAAMRSYVATCEANLWSRRGASAREWLLDERRLDPDVLRANHVGADPGPRLLPRATGLPRGVGVVFPALDQERRVVYLQLRSLAGDGPKYRSPSTRAFGVSPRLAWIVPPDTRASERRLVVTEGICDGLTAVGAGVEAVALLGAATTNDVVAEQLAARGGNLVLALDADTAGRASTARLRALLSSAGRRGVVALPIPDNRDLNDWARELGPRFESVLRASIARCARPGADHAWPRAVSRQ